MALRLGLEVGRWDWWNLKDEHTPYEWALQRAAFAVEPWGSHRDDIRTALATLAMIQHSVGGLTEDGARELYERLVGYTEPQTERVVSPDEAAAIVGTRK